MGDENRKPYDLEERTLEFAKRIRAFVKCLPRTMCNIEDVKQLIRCSGSVGANYIEANESLGKKDFGMRIKISRKEKQIEQSNSNFGVECGAISGFETILGKTNRAIDLEFRISNLFRISNFGFRI